MLSLAVASLLSTGAFAAGPPAYGGPRSQTAPIGSPSSYAAPAAYSSAGSLLVYPTGATQAFSSKPPTETATAPSSTFPAPLGLGNYFSLVVNVTGTGNLTEGSDRYYNNGLSTLPLTAWNCDQTGEFCCSQPVIFSGSYNPYSSNPSVFDLAPTSNASGAPLQLRQDIKRSIWGNDCLRIIEADEQGRRPVRQTHCDGEKGTPGMSFASQPFAHLVFDDAAGFGSFYVCWVEANLFGPTLFYRSENQTVPDACADVVLIPSW